jgi:hypothetical protein
MSNQSPKIFFSFLYANVGCPSPSFFWGGILSLGNQKNKGPVPLLERIFVAKNVLKVTIFP